MSAMQPTQPTQPIQPAHAANALPLRWRSAAVIGLASVIGIAARTQPRVADARSAIVPAVAALVPIR